MAPLPAHAACGGAVPRILIVGDSMLDCYWEGAVERISPEAPVPVLHKGRDWVCAGGAANVALNAARLGGQVTLATLLGTDDAGDRLAALLADGGLRLEAERCAGWPTTQKIRVVCRRQQLLRIDVEEPAPADCVGALGQRVRALLPSHRFVLLSDYAKGCLRDCSQLLQAAGTAGCHTLVDPKGDDFARYRGAWLIKPNAQEARGAVGAWHDEADFTQRMLTLRRRLEVQHLLVTRGEVGMTLFSADTAPVHVPAVRREVYDVSGAGDTVLAALATQLADGATLADAMGAANAAAGVVVGRFGTATVSRQELQAALGAG